MELLQNFDSDVFIFKTYFYQKFAVESFEGVKNYYRRYDFLSKKLILIPVHYGPHWFLISYGGGKLESCDPHNYPGKEDGDRIKLLEADRYSKSRILKDLRDNYFKKIFQKQNKQYTEISIAVHLPPSIPSQENFHDCGVFLLSVAKYLVSDIYTLPLFQIRHFLSYGNIVRENRLKVLFMSDHL